jgi:phosphorylcholine metabolism protein LicD
MEVNNLGQTIYTTVEEAINPEDDLRTAKTILEKLDVSWYLAFGTALGFYRDKDFIKGDTDIDIAILADKDTPFGEIMDKFQEEYQLIRSVTKDGKIYQMCFQGYDYFIIDICFFYRNDDVYESYCEGGKWEDKVDTVSLTKELQTKYGNYPIPFHIEEYLTARYGDWQTPKPGAITSSIKV